MATPLLEVRALHAQYGPTKVLHGLDFSVAAGGITTLLGANGAGKTTTLRAVCAMVRTQGEVLLDGARIDARPTETIVRMGVAHVPDGRGTFLNLSVEENLRLCAYTRRDRADIAADYDRMYGYFPRLKERRRQQAGTLSGGEQQMLAVARALARDVKLLLLDEPYEGLAPVIVREIEKILHEVKELGFTTIIVEQNAIAALNLADRAIILDMGEVVFDGTAREVIDNVELRREYLAV